MGVFKYAYYVYLIFALLFIVDGIEKMDKKSPFLSFAIAAVAIFMFFFRRKFTQKFQDRYKNRQK
jgi:hypothetical protein